MPNSVTVTLAERQYVIKELPSRKNMAWRQALQAPFGDLVDALASAPGIEVDNTAGMTQLTDLVRTLTSRVFGSIDLMRDMLFNYSPALAADRERIEDEGFDSEVVSAFTEVLKLAFPFGSMIDLASRAIAKAGQQAKQT
jgi:hypothetical protein